MTQEQFKRRLPVALVALALTPFGGSAVSADDAKNEVPPTVRNRSIGYVLTTDHWAVHTTENKAECPDGTNDGPREQYKILFPDNGTKRTVLETELKREADIWFPNTDPEPYPFKEAISKVAPGLNLDGKIDANDFTSPDGEVGIDNQFYRAIGCVNDYRPGGSIYHFNNFYMQKWEYTRTVIELTEVDSLINDDDVIVSVYRGLDPLVTDASGNGFVPYGTQRIDERWGKKFEARFRGKIVDGVLITEPGDVNLPYHYAFQDYGFILYRDSRMRLTLTPEKASGLWGGYVDVRSWHRAINGALNTHSQSYGQQSAQSIFKAMSKLADAYPDPVTGRNTAISAAKTFTFSQVFIKRPRQEMNPGQSPQNTVSAGSLESPERVSRRR